MSYFDIFRPEFEKTIVIFEISTFEFVGKKLNLETIWVFLDWNLKNSIVILEISTLEYIKYEFLTNACNFDTGSVFSKGL